MFLATRVTYTPALSQFILRENLIQIFTPLSATVKLKSHLVRRAVRSKCVKIKKSNNGLRQNGTDHRLIIIKI